MSKSSSCQLIDSVEAGCIKNYSLRIAESIYQTFNVKQKHLYDGYVRMEIVSQINYIPKDIIKLCNRFFVVDIKLWSEENPMEYHCAELCNFAKKCYKDGEYWIACHILRCLCEIAPFVSRYHNEIALALTQWRELDQAEDSYKLAIELKPTSHIFKWNYALLLNRRRKYHKSLSLFNQAMKLDPNEPEYYSQAANCCVKLHDFDKAKEFYLKSISFKPKLANIYCEYARLLYKTGDTNQGEKYLEMAVEIDPETDENKHKNNNWEQIYEIAKFIRDEIRDYDKAEIWYNKCLESSNCKSYVHSSFGYLLILLKKYDKARKHLEIAKDIDGCWRCLYLGLLHYKLGDTQQANQCLDRAVSMVSDIDGILYLLKTTKEQNPQSMPYLLRYERLLRDKMRRQ